MAVKGMSGERWFWGMVAGMVGIAGYLAVSSAMGETQTWDEGIHVFAGYSYLTGGDYRWNPEHPPLAKIASALPLAFLGLQLPQHLNPADETRAGIDFLYGNTRSADAILLAARGMTIVLALLFLVAVAWWVRARFGAAAALLAVCFCAFDPNLMAHGRYVTTDFPVTAFYFLTCTLWLDYLGSGRSRELLLASAAFALAMVTKFSAVLLVPALAVLFAIRWIQAPREFPLRRAAAAAAALASTTLLAVLVVYWPETLRCWTSHVPRLANAVNRENLVGQFLYLAGTWLNLPAHAFLTGLGKVAAHNREGHASYLMGMRSDLGWWYYFPVVFAVKSTIAALIATLLVAAGGMGVMCRRWKLPFHWWGLAVPPVIYFAFSMSSAINIGMRHILPVYPFLYVAAAALLAQALPRRAAACAMIALGALQMAECASIAPHYLAFFNALSGGPGNGPRYLLDSNIDWGQDVKKLARWLDAHGTHTAYIGYFGNAPMPYYGINAIPFPAPLDEQGWNALDGYAICSVTPLNGVYVPLELLAPLRLREPIAKIGWSMYVYDFRKRAVR